MRLIDASVDNLEWAVKEAADVLSKGGIVACPTETYYGLCARYDDEAALERLFVLKGSRRQSKPSPLIVGSMDALPLLVSESGHLFEKLAWKFWPGPLTLVVRARPHLSGRIAKEGKVALRMPGASFALVLAKAFGMPLTATSANPSGLRPARSAAQVAEYFKDGVDLIVDAGESPGGPPSTIVDATGDAPVLLRQGAIRFGDIEKYFSGPA
ncbi:MAG: L-threonylcarbamoyladenylate synthase [Nitrospiraceae bacterium]|nr:L-threonylcarbamoyladenylate synthase [Nitrospiraceae bacterium]